MRDADLAMRCYRLNELGAQVQRHLAADLKKLAEELSVYDFYERLKGGENIQEKVLRMRDEAGAQAKPGSVSKPFDAEDVTDAWGCRLVTLFQSEILEVMSGILRLIEAWAREDEQDCRVRIHVINIYTNRPDNDPLSIAGKAAQLVENFNASPAMWTEGESKFESRINRCVDSRDTGYSSIHFVLQAWLVRKAIGGRVSHEVKFEIQIRDIFEEAWGQVSHALSYSDKDRFYRTGVRPSGTAEMIARPHLNGLKTVADGCSQLAEQIRRTYGDLRGRLSVVGLGTTYRSITPLREICNSIVKWIPGERAELSDAVRTAYGLVQDARDAADGNFDNRVARSNYLAAARKFEEVIGRAEGLLNTELHDRKTIEWYLKIEWANALVFSLPAKLKDAEEMEERDYRRALGLYQELEAKLPGDPVMLLRRAQAERKAVRSEDDAIAVIRRLDNCLKLLGEGAEKRPGEAALTEQLARIELALARLDYSSYVSSRDARAGEAALRQAIREVHAIVPERVPGQSDPELLRVYHRAMSNVLWFFHRLRTIEGARLQEGDLAIIRSNVDKLHGRVFWPTVRFYAETIENLMYGYEIIGDDRRATEMAELNLRLLRQLGDDRRKARDSRDPTELLNADEKEMYLHALDFLHHLMKRGPKA